MPWRQCCCRLTMCHCRGRNRSFDCGQKAGALKPPRTEALKPLRHSTAWCGDDLQCAVQRVVGGSTYMYICIRTCVTTVMRLKKLAHDVQQIDSALMLLHILATLFYVSGSLCNPSATHLQPSCRMTCGLFRTGAIVSPSARTGGWPVTVPVPLQWINLYFDFRL